MVCWLVKDLTFETIGQILLCHPVIAVGMGVEITLAMPKALFVSRGVLKVTRNLTLLLVFNGLKCIEKGQG